MYRLERLSRLKTVLTIIAVVSLMGACYYAFYGGLGFIPEPRNYGWVNGENILFCSSAIIFMFSTVLCRFIDAIQQDIEDHLDYMKRMLTRHIEK